MSKTIRPKQGVVYECYKGFTDIGGDRCRTGQKFVWKGETKARDIYVLSKASGRGMEMYVRGELFAAHFIPAGQQVETKPKFKVGDKVMISDDSTWHSWSDYSNPANTEGIITEIKDCDLGIFVEWSNDTTNSYNDHDLVLVGAEQESYIDVTEKLKQYSMKAIVVSNIEQIKELAKVSFLKDQIESQFPELFITHKVGNRYKHEDENQYILTGENSHVALVNLTTGMVESYTVRVENFNNITADEFKGLCLDTDKLTLISK